MKHRKENQYLPVSRFLLLSTSEISILIQIIIFFFNSVETPFTWKASITSSSFIFPEDSLLHQGLHHENEPGCSGLGRCFSRPYFIISCCVVVDVFIVIVIIIICLFYSFILYMSTLYCYRMKMWIVQQPVHMLLKTCIAQIRGHP